MVAVIRHIPNAAVEPVKNVLRSRSRSSGLSQMLEGAT
jgi:hypothetical protein